MCTAAPSTQRAGCSTRLSLSACRPCAWSTSAAGFMAGPAFDDAAAVINEALDRGRTWPRRHSRWRRASSGSTCGEVRDYWIDDGFYGTLSCIHIGHYVPHTRPHCASCAGEKTYTSAVFGPTCDRLPQHGGDQRRRLPRARLRSDEEQRKIQFRPAR
ncbi:hypothetical protein QYE76_069195 [Lolium multiflorum]|uniref:Orn/DAP/Arg decarboxylase 2 C-terminal domain-containing protein n=1 Tax=Lolium multiflorum TaxID=4521 RepID=A0AAD8SI46_LOLMU|nr:hypothetical protein QYE76_069195 [Lolium multiflorum]